MPKSDVKPMCCEDADDDGQVIEGSYKYARSNIASTPPSPVKQHPQQQQQMNTSRKKSSRRADPTSPPFSESDSTEHASSTRKNKEKKFSSRGKGKEVVVEKEKRPQSRTIKTTPARSRASDEASYYGVTQQTVASSRPKAYTARPQSYYGQTSASRPPLSQSAQWSGYAPPGPPGPLAPNQSSYPPPQWMVAPPLGSSPYGASPTSGLGSMDYFGRTPDPLASRFVRPEHRPRSAMGMRPPSYGPDDYEAPEKSIIRRPSLSKRTPKEQEDRMRMPPPSRPQTTQPNRPVFKAPPPQRKSVVFPDDELLDFEPEYPLSRHTSIDYGKALPIRSRRQSLGPEYNHEQYAIEPVPTKSRREKRRSTSYALGNKHDDQIRNASQYQDEVNGGPTAHLTAENLRQVKNGSSSHSTRSSASRDESSYRQSATTRTTRSGSGDDDITIKLHGGAVVEVGSTKISCIKGGEINIPRAGGGSDRGTVYDDDLKSRASRYERPVARTRSNSQSAYTRALPAPPYGGYAPPLPYHNHMEYAPYPSGYAPYGAYHYEDEGGYF
jgi:hypothetical protein